jgi:hypothetical protein
LDGECPNIIHRVIPHPLNPCPPNPFGDNRNSEKPGKPRISDYPKFSFSKDDPITGLHVASFSQSHDPNIERPNFLASGLLEMWGPTFHNLKENFLYFYIYLFL